MTPEQFAIELRNIASKIDNSESPRRDLVSADLKKLIIAADIDMNTIVKGWSGFEDGYNKILKKADESVNEAKLFLKGAKRAILNSDKIKGLDDKQKASIEKEWDHRIDRLGKMQETITLYRDDFFALANQISDYFREPEEEEEE